MRRHARVLVAIAVLGAFFAFAGQAFAAGYEHVGAVSLYGSADSVTGVNPGSGDGQFNAPQRSAVEPSSGDIFIVDSKNGRVQVFSPQGNSATYLTQFGGGTLSEPFGIAISESAGATSVYVTDAGSNQIVKFDSDGAATPSFSVDPSYVSPAQGGGEAEISSFAAPIALAPNGDLWVADGALLKRFDSSGAHVASSNIDGSTSGQAFQNLLDLAVDSSGDVIVVDAAGSLNEVVNGAASRVERFGADGSDKGPIGPVEGGAAVVAVNPFDDSVLVGGQIDSYNSFKPLRIFVFDTAGNPVTSVEMPGGEGNSEDHESATWGIFTGLAADPSLARQRLYAVSDTDRFEEGFNYGTISLQVFRMPTPPAVPEPTVLAAASVGPTLAKLQGAVNPHSLPTTYWFEYGPTTSYGTAVPAGHDDAGEGDTPVGVSRWINGLAPGTAYHYRVVAENALGTIASADQTFRTPDLLGPPAASNRVYEMVSPLAKGGVDVSPSYWGTKSSNDGNRVIWLSNAFPSSNSASVESYFISTRGADGWSTVDMSPPWTPLSQQSVQPYFQAFATDLSKAAFFTSEPALTPEAQRDTGNIYLLDNNAQGNPYTLVTPSGPPGATVYDFDEKVAAASNDLSHVLVESPWRLTEDAPLSASPNLYEWANGEIRLASVLPNGQPAEGAYAGGKVGGYPVGVRGGSYGGYAMSNDGSRVLFTDMSNGQIYVRENGTTTIPVSKSQRSVPDPGGSQPAVIQGATPDGGKVFFASDEMLTDDAPGGGLYMFDVDSGELTDLTASMGAGDGALVGASDDGSRVYFQRFDGHPSIYLWHDGAVEKVADLGSTDTESCNWSLHTVDCGGPKPSRVSSDGRFLLLNSIEPLSGYDTRGEREVYLYDSASDDMQCASCNPAQLDHSTGGATVITEGGPTGRFRGIETNPLTDSGSVVFETAQALLPRDKNNLTDVYLFSAGELQLVSTGAGNDNAYVGDISPDGRDIFFVTRASLVAIDTDRNADMYDARIGGGLASQQVQAAPPCQGDACQAPPIPPSDPTPASAGFSGSGNVKGHFKKPRKRAKAHHKKKKRHHSKRTHRGKSKSPRHQQTPTTPKHG